MLAVGATDTGRVRSQNQDVIFFSATPVGPLPNLFIVADGMGGHSGGEIASHEATTHFAEIIKTAQPTEDYLDLLVSAAHAANKTVYQQSQNDDALKGMGTTFTACTIRENKIEIIHVGDTRIYALAPGRITQLTNDHTYVGEMLKSGELNEAQAREHPQGHVLMRALGFDEHLEADGYAHDLADTAHILLCSDGLSNMLTNDEIYNIATQPGDISIRLQKLLDDANEQGGKDNISVILIDISRGEMH